MGSPRATLIEILQCLRVWANHNQILVLLLVLIVFLLFPNMHTSTKPPMWVWCGCSYGCELLWFSAGANFVHRVRSRISEKGICACTFMRSYHCCTLFASAPRAYRLLWKRGHTTPIHQLHMAQLRQGQEAVKWRMCSPSTDSAIMPLAAAAKQT